MTLQSYDDHGPGQNRNQKVTEFSNDVYVYGKLYADLVGGLTGDGGALEVDQLIVDAAYKKDKLILEKVHITKSTMNLSLKKRSHTIVATNPDIIPPIAPALVVLYQNREQIIAGVKAAAIPDHAKRTNQNIALTSINAASNATIPITTVTNFPISESTLSRIASFRVCWITSLTTEAEARINSESTVDIIAAKTVTKNKPVTIDGNSSIIDVLPILYSDDMLMIMPYELNID